MGSEPEKRSFNDFDNTGLWMFYEETKNTYGLDVAEDTLQLILNEKDPIKGNPAEVAEWAKSLIPRTHSDDLVEDKYHLEVLNLISALQEIHDLPEPHNQLQTDLQIYNQGVDANAEFEIYTLGYGIVDSLVSNQPIEAEFYGELIETTPEEIMTSIDSISQRPGAEVRTPKFVDFYVEKRYGRGYRMLGREIDAFESVPQDRNTFGITPTKSIANATKERDGVVITINDIYLSDEETNIAPPRWFANKT